ncbi:MAG: SRPBCC family protein [Desulfococcaceae bacterium]
MSLFPRTLAVRISINAPPGRVWRLLADTHGWPRWGPSVQRVEATHRFIEKGDRGRVKTAAGVWLPFEITEFDPGRYWAWKVAGVRATGHRVEPNDSGGCRLAFEVPSIAFPYLSVCRWAAGRIRKMAEGEAG